MVMTVLVGLIAAFIVAIRLSRRILSPINSVAEGLRSLAEGDLSARAIADDRTIGEAATLADDFNAMATRFERMSKEQTFWNAAIAHELRTPVTILRGRLQGLAEGVFLPEPSQFHSLLSQVESLTRLIEDLRTVSLSDSGHLRLQLMKCDLAAEISVAVHLFETSLKAAGLSPELHLQSGLVICDSIRIRQALLALMENARRHADAGTLRVSLSFSTSLCLLSVEDSGPGIADEFLGRMFDAFQRGDPSRSREGGGSGLGLAVVKAIAQAHGGKATARRSAIGGTIIELSWPQLGPG